MPFICRRADIGVVGRYQATRALTFFAYPLLLDGADRRLVFSERLRGHIYKSVRAEPLVHEIAHKPGSRSFVWR